MKRILETIEGPVSVGVEEYWPRDIVTRATREHEKHEPHHNQMRAKLSGGSWRATVRERVRMAETPAIAAWPPAIY